MNNPVEAAGNVCSTNARRSDKMAAVQRALGRIDERPQQGKFHHGKFYIVTSWIFETQRLAVELPPTAKSKAAIADRPSRADGKTSHASDPVLKMRSPGVTEGATGVLARLAPATWLEKRVWRCVPKFSIRMAAA